MVEELRNDDNKIRNDLRQHRNELLMYGRYNLNSLRGVINTINVRIEKSYIAAGTDYYSQLRISELLMWKSITHIYYCEELFLIKHKSRHSCVSAIFYNLGPATITKNCKFDYYYNTTVPPVILDGGRDVLLANFQGCLQLKKEKLAKLCKI